jgi:hypothetical protein
MRRGGGRSIWSTVDTLTARISTLVTLEIYLPCPCRDTLAVEREMASNWFGRSGTRNGSATKVLISKIIIAHRAG